jgi:hypothetical protein
MTERKRTPAMERTCGLSRETKLPRQRAEPLDDILNAMKQIAEVTNGYKGNFDNFRPVPSNGLNLCRFGRRRGGPYAMRQGVPFSPCIVDLRQQLGKIANAGCLDGRNLQQHSYPICHRARRDILANHEHAPLFRVQQKGEKTALQLFDIGPQDDHTSKSGEQGRIKGFRLGAFRAHRSSQWANRICCCCHRVNFL